MEQHLDRNHIEQSEDWLGNNAAFTCPVCKKVYIVSGVGPEPERKVMPKLRPIDGLRNRG